MINSLLISKGDKITNHEGLSVLVLSVEQGQYGLLVKGIFNSGHSCISFLPYELSPLESISSWYGWANRAYFILANGIKVGAVCFWRYETLISLVEHEKEWERTIEAMRREENEVYSSFR